MIPDDAWPQGDRLCWWDDESRTYWDFTTEPYTERPYTVEENGDADARRAVLEAAGRPVILRAQIAELLAEPSSPERTESLVEALARLVLEVP